MSKISFLFASSLYLFSPLSPVSADENWTPEQLKVLESIDRLSAATSSGGDGADGYSEILAENFSRWTIGGKLINDKAHWVEGVREWLDDGWRVADRDQTVMQVAIVDDYAFVRRVVEEEYLGPNGERALSKAGLSETWILVDGNWVLFLVNADVLENI